MFIADSKEVTVSTKGFSDIIDITTQVRTHVTASRVHTGTATLFVLGSTAALTTIENEPGLVRDLQEFLEQLIPSNRRYHHDDRWGDDNGFSHLRAAILGPSLSVPIGHGEMRLGTWQQIVLLDFDNRPRTRDIIVQIIGETA